MRWLVALLGWVVLGVSAAVTLDRFLPYVGRWPVMAAAFATYTLIGFALALLLLLPLAGRRGWARPWYFAGATVALLGIGLQGWLVAPLYVGSRAGTATDLTVMSANLEVGGGDADTVVRTATDRHVGVLVLQEVTPSELTALDASGLAQLLPNRVGTAQPGVRGTMVFSTYPLTEQGTLPLANGGLAVQVAAPQPFSLLAVHTATPTDDVRRWAADLRTVRDHAQESLAAHRPLLVVGDFNATTDHALFRRVLATGLSDATAQANSGWQPTWPTKYRRSWYRPLIAIDHVLTSRRYSARSTSTVSVPDTDHLALVVTLQRRQ
ncbi:endonuclease/exonuclease/phosphatase family protein [Nocardioides mangrovicus]|uniref:Endonuclease/exonuclease/phosphatase family protein n=1 Tax=Nocardioides mangrovicus TaxID=2478913 RepID=A0A3L8P794_9ACTN|nr:endonuclease/exonuclease/phosphatase family protein [Nocardioides mangrovicus]RLV51085.1 endonuclease/exonuclease/phosphatase family protein [Nocardioides mangrovicus]